ncbi:uncharacterized protein A4U43_C07F29740 [Asparagus officinalis]|uniref:Sulfhydryl oxidase n=1 Tax=Asparagus officinalis TaxID=4686 RepID=A0A5P1EJK4_ASPOF|nr:uncharacterized protein A4U43_C07F29740 [Asparagus officinalis]
MGSWWGGVSATKQGGRGGDGLRGDGVRAWGRVNERTGGGCKGGLLKGAKEALQAGRIWTLEKSATPLTKEELGRGTWALLHAIAAQYPDQPTRQQKRDAKELMAILSRLYPCKECADHFKDVLKANPVHAGSQAEFSQWLCHVHNVVNRSLGKLTFPCQRVNARWGKLDCKDRACDLQGTPDLK